MTTRSAPIVAFGALFGGILGYIIGPLAFLIFGLMTGLVNINSGVGDAGLLTAPQKRFMLDNSDVFGAIGGAILGGLFGLALGRSIGPKTKPSSRDESDWSS